jgi:hypothetical protein
VWTVLGLIVFAAWISRLSQCQGRQYQRDRQAEERQMDDLQRTLDRLRNARPRHREGSADPAAPGGR